MNSLSMLKLDVDTDILAETIRQAKRPVHVTVLARVAARTWLHNNAGSRFYAPGRQYAPGELVRFEEQLVTVKAVEDGGNLKQGSFKILTLVFPDGTERYMAAEVPQAPAKDDEPVFVTDQQVDRLLQEHGLSIRTTLQKILNSDRRFVWFQDTQGDQWCLAEMLPVLRDRELAEVKRLLRGRLEGDVLIPRPTEDLVRKIWGQKNDGSNDYLLKAFALNAALAQCADVRWLGNGWVLEAEWKQLVERPSLTGPRQSNVIRPPEGVTFIKDTGDDQDTPEKEQNKKRQTSNTTITDDIIAWREKRLQAATLTLKAQHYYGNWLPLTKELQQVLPPRASGADAITFLHRFGGEEGSFPAWVDWEQKRILASPEMYRVFREYGIYPGTKLVISHRGSEQEYEIRTKPVEGERRVLVRRVILAEDGTLEYEEVEEPVRYEIAEDVFVADARWEDLEALFKQAEQAGSGIFQLMYDTCTAWWENTGRKPLHVTADELFEAIHFSQGGRLTSKATIAWELWRRKAFQPIGNGKYLFRPGYGDRVRSIGPGRRKHREPSVLNSKLSQRDDRDKDHTASVETVLQPENGIQQNSVEPLSRREQPTDTPESLPGEAVLATEKILLSDVPKPVTKSLSTEPLAARKDDSGILTNKSAQREQQAEPLTSSDLLSDEQPEFQTQQGANVQEVLPFLSRGFVGFGSEPRENFGDSSSRTQAYEAICPSPNTSDEPVGTIHSPAALLQLTEGDVNIEEAFDTLIRKLTLALKQAQEAGALAFQEGHFDRAHEEAKRGQEIEAQLKQLQKLYHEWNRLIGERDSTAPETSRLKRGEKTPTEEFWLPILSALEEMGGQGRVQDILSRVERMMKDRLSDVDWQVLGSGKAIRWRNTAQWARYEMIQAGLLSSDAPRGIWQITQAGRAYLQTHQANLLDTEKRQSQIIEPDQQNDDMEKLRPERLYSRQGVLWIMGKIGGLVSPRDIFEEIERSGELTSYDLALDDGAQIRYRHVVHGHLQDLKREGLIRHVARSQWQITKKGQAYLKRRLTSDLGSSHVEEAHEGNS